MKLVATTVGRKGPGDVGKNKERLRAAELALEKAIKLRANVLALPAGFFTVHSSEARNGIASSLINVAKQLNIAIIFGVDQEVKNPSKNWELEIRGRGLPWYGYAWSPSENITLPHCWSQRSFTSTNQWWASDERCKEVRLLGVGDETIGILMCGEIFNQRIRNALAEHSPRPKAIVDVAHIGSGFRVWQGMKKLVELGLAAVCSVHAQCEHAMKHCYVPEKGCVSSRIPDAYIYGPPRIELKLWIF